MLGHRNLHLLGATLLLIGGAIHLQLSLDDYGTADIDRAFALNALVSAVVAAYLVIHRDAIGPLAGIGVSVATLVVFALSRTGDGILDFRASGLDPSPQTILTLVAEVAATIAFGLALAHSWRSRSSSE